MAAGVAIPRHKELRTNQVAATFVVPAPQGCNLDCPFCFIRARREARPEEQVLQLNNYLHFLEIMHQRCDIGLVSIQGYEPLLPESWSYSQHILQKAANCRIDSALVTNGTYLSDRVSDLVALNISGITVSLDAADSAHHDLTRRTVGAFRRTMKGLERACSSPLRERITVSSVLQQGKFHYLTGMPKLLASVGIREWVVSPIYIVKHTQPGELAGNNEETIFILLRLKELAEEHDVNLVVDIPPDGLEQFAANIIRRTDHVIRLSPDGTCVTAHEVWRRINKEMPRWIPGKESAEDFVDRFITTQPTLRDVINPSPHNLSVVA